MDSGKGKRGAPIKNFLDMRVCGMPQVQAVPEGAIFGRIAGPIKCVVGRIFKKEMRKRRAGFDHQAVHPAAGKFRKHLAPSRTKIAGSQHKNLNPVTSSKGLLRDIRKHERLSRLESLQGIRFFAGKNAMPRPEDLHRIVPAGIPHVKRGIVRKERSSPHKNRIAHRAQFMVPAVRTLTRYAKRGMRAIGPCYPH